MYRYRKLKNRDGSTVDEHRRIAGVEKMGFNTVVHHIDGNKLNNNPSNLQVMSRSEHCKIHGFGITVRALPLFAPDYDNTAICRQCKRRFPWEFFISDKNATYGKRSVCRECWNINKKRWGQKNKKAAL